MDKLKKNDEFFSTKIDKEARMITYSTYEKFLTE